MLIISIVACTRVFSYLCFLSKRAAPSQILSFILIAFACSKEDKELDSKKLKSFAKNILLLCQKMGGYPQRRRA